MLFYGAHGSEVVAVGGGAAGAEDPAALAVLVVERVREAFEGVQVDGGFQLDRAVQEGAGGRPGSFTGIWESAERWLSSSSASLVGRGRSRRKPMPLVSGTSSLSRASGMNTTAVVPP